MSASVTNQDQNTQEVKQLKKQKKNAKYYFNRTTQNLSQIVSSHYPFTSLQTFFFREKVFVWV